MSGAWPFLVRGVICLLYCDNERDQYLLNSGYDIQLTGCWVDEGEPRVKVVLVSAKMVLLCVLLSDAQCSTRLV